MLKIDEARHEVRVKSREIHLAPKEFAILVTLKNADGRVLSRHDLRSAISKKRDNCDGRTIDQHISRLRRKLKGINVIRTVVSSGYKYIGA